MTISETVGGAIYGTWESILDTLYEVNLYKQNKTKELKIIVKILHDNREIETTYGLLSDRRDFLYIPDLKRIHFNPILYQDGKYRICFLPWETHESVPAAEYIKIMNGIRYDMSVLIKRGRVFHEIKLKNIRSTIDFNVFKCRYSVKFANQSFDLVQTKILSFLQDMSNQAKLLTLLLAGTIGFILGGMTYSMLLK
jgi:hypothetical protein